MFLKNFVRICHGRFSNKWGWGIVVITTIQLHSTKPELRICVGSCPPRGVFEIPDGEDLWQWPWLKIRLNTFCRSTIPEKQLIIIIIVIIIIRFPHTLQERHYVIVPLENHDMKCIETCYYVGVCKSEDWIITSQCNEVLVEHCYYSTVNSPILTAKVGRFQILFYWRFGEFWK